MVYCTGIVTIATKDVYVCAGSVLGHPQLGRPETWTVPLVGTDVTLVEQVEGFTKVRHQLLARPAAHSSLPLSQRHSTSSMVSIIYIHSHTHSYALIFTQPHSQADTLMLLFCFYFTFTFTFHRYSHCSLLWLM